MSSALQSKCAKQSREINRLLGVIRDNQEIPRWHSDPRTLALQDKLGEVSVALSTERKNSERLARLVETLDTHCKMWAARVNGGAQ